MLPKVGAKSQSKQKHRNGIERGLIKIKVDDNSFVIKALSVV